MPLPAIRVENLGKRYRLGATHSQTLGDLLSSAAGQLFGRRNGNVATPKLSDNASNQIDKDGNFWALKDVSFDIQPGEVVGIIGHNGAGKSTLLKLLSNIASPSTGRVELHGRVASLLEVGTGFHPELTGRENVYLNGAILGMTKKEIRQRFDEILAFSETDQFIDTPVKRYSSGMYVRLAFAVAAHLEPEILIVDEVLAVGDAAFQKKCLGRVNSLASDGRTVILVTHNMLTLQHLTSSAILFESGRLISHGKTSNVIETYIHRSAELRKIGLLHRTDRQGSGALRVESIEFHDHNDNPVDTLICGLPARLLISFSLLPPYNARQLDIAIGIDDALGQRVTHLTTVVQPVDRDKFSGMRGTFIIDIPRLPLAPGKYSLTSFCEVNKGVADWVQNAATFTVEQGDFFNSGKLIPIGQGSVLIDHCVSIASDGAAPRLPDSFRNPQHENVTDSDHS